MTPPGCLDRMDLAVSRSRSPEFSMKDLGTLKWFLGMHVEHDRNTGSLKLHQRQYIERTHENLSKAVFIRLRDFLMGTAKFDHSRYD